MKENIGKVMTVLGPVEPEKLGHTLPHEHTLNWLSHYEMPDADPEKRKFFEQPVTLDNLYYILNENFYGIRDNLLNYDDEFFIEELKRFKKAGGGTVVDLTGDDNTMYYAEGKPTDPLHNPGTDEHWSRLKALSEKSGAQIVAAVAHFPSNGKTDFSKLSVDDIAAYYIDRIKNGYGATGVKPGIIGEIGTGDVITDAEWKCLRAAAIAANETGLAVNVHVNVYQWRHDFKIVKLFQEEGMDLNKLAFSHREACLIQDNWSEGDGFGHLQALMDKGCYISFDGVGNMTYEKMVYGSWCNASDKQRAQAIYKLIVRGYQDRILLSHDSAERHRFSQVGGYCLNHINTRFREICNLVGVENDEFDSIICTNPQRLMTIK